MDLISFVGVVLLASAFPLARWSGRLTVANRRRWEALSAGVAVAYMFVSVLPDLAEHGPVVAESAVAAALSAEKRIYIWALAGFVAFAGLSELEPGRDGEAARKVMYLAKMAGFAIYVFLIGYLLVFREDPTHISLWLYAVAMGLHLFMLDIIMADHFRGLYERDGRMVLIACAFLGWAMGSVHALPEALTSRLFAFVLGGVTITSAHEELAVERAGHFWWFIAGSAVYASILLLV